MSFYESIFIVVIVEGVVFEKGSAAPTDSLIPIFTLVFTGKVQH
jgi:hypothetical protein